MLGKIVKVTVDRAMGTYHPEHPELYYPINYGYIEDRIAADGEYEDAYILGVSAPVSELFGRVIAIIRRTDDVENKWVVAPDGVSFTAEEIKEDTYFQEKYFNSYVELWKK